MCSNRSRNARNQILHELRRELMGPSEPEEIIHEYPCSRYIVGRLAPSRSSDDDIDAKIDAVENDTLGAGANDDEAGQDEQDIPLIVGFNPSSIGISFLIDETVKQLRVELSWGDYKREVSNDTFAWKRYQREGVINGIPVNRPGKIRSISLKAGKASCGAIVEGLNDSEIYLEGIVRDFSGYRAVSLFLVNRRTKGELHDRDKDERWIFQPEMRVLHPERHAVFVAKDILHESSDSQEDGETQNNNFLYRHSREFATGHGVAADWERPTLNVKKTTYVFTKFIPEYEVPKLIPPDDIAGGAVLDMKDLARVDSGEALASMLEPLVVKYEEWIDALEHAIQESDIVNHQASRDAAELNLKLCRNAAIRIRAGLTLINNDTTVFEAFRFANRAMWDQRIHSIWAAVNQKQGNRIDNISIYDVSKNRSWRPFQIGFILLNLAGIANETCSDRRIVDLLWFPTGGGKTEAYLGLAAFTIGLRRLRGNRHSMVGEAGTSIFMRYTLRLLTVQQFQRATTLIAACEIIRRENPQLWGNEPFQIGLWVGRGTTPNTYLESKEALERIQIGKRPKEGSPIQLVSCPWCGTSLTDDKGRPNNTYICDDYSQRTRIYCPDKKCEFSYSLDQRVGIPAVVVDSEIYRACPTLILATVDKFARMPFKGETQALFGIRNRYSKKYGHITEAHGDRVENRAITDSEMAPRLLPPDLIIQDELHLISGPLGTMVGLYETAVEYLSSLSEPGDVRMAPKIIASTATIRRAHHQAKQLYNRELHVYPPSGLSARDSFFASELDIDEKDDSTAGRLYVGVNAPGSSTKTLLVRVYSVLLAAAQKQIEEDATAGDPYGTLVGYFNSLRALGGAKRLVEDDIKLVRLKYLSNQRGFTKRNIFRIEELTSRIDSWTIPKLLKKLNLQFPRGKEDYPIDALLATNMISVGVDIDRLGLMVVTGQPKTTSEYIQATSRVGRSHPGLVVTMYNWLGARDLSHYERFCSYHASIYRYVEAISVTPFSSRALDRGLMGIFAGMNRLAGSSMSMEVQAQNFDPTDSLTIDIISEIERRAKSLVGKTSSLLVRDRLLSLRDEWGRLSSYLLRYSWLDDSRRPPNNTRVLLRTLGTENEGEWPTPGSLREVEPSAAFFLDEMV